VAKYIEVIQQSAAIVGIPFFVNIVETTLLRDPDTPLGRA
jgi:hypothetical protein